MSSQSEHVVGMRTKIKAQAEHIRRLEAKIHELRSIVSVREGEPVAVVIEKYEQGEIVVRKVTHREGQLRLNIGDKLYAGPVTK